MMKSKKIVAGILAAAITVSSIAPEAFASIIGSDSNGNYCVNVSNLIDNDTDISNVYGATVKFTDESAEVLSRGAGGGFVFNTSRGWDQLQWCTGCGEKETHDIFWNTETNSITRLDTSPICTEDDIVMRSAEIALSQWWGDDISIKSISLLDKDGNELTSKDMPDNPVPGDSSGGIEEPDEPYPGESSGDVPEPGEEETDYIDITCSSVEQIQTPHPYKNNSYYSYTYTDESCKNLKLTFSEGSYTEYSCDTVTIYDETGEECTTLSGNDLSGTSVLIPGNTVKIVLTTDVSINRYGFRVESVENVDEVPKQGDPEYDFVIGSEAIVDTSEYLYYLKKYRGAGGDVVIPSVIDGKKIEKIGDNAFSDNTALTGVEIPDGVKEIGPQAFSNCASLSSVSIPDSVRFIENEAFLNCSSLKSVTIPASVTYIGDYAFGYHQGYLKIEGFTLKYVKNTEGHLYAARNGFTDESCFATRERYDGTLRITGYCGTDENYIIPPEIDGKKITDIGHNAFRNSTSLKSVTIPDSVTSISWQAFYGCTSLTSVIIPDSVTGIDGEAFLNCTSLKSVTIPASVTYINDNAFGYECDENLNYTKVDGFTLNYIKNTAGHLYAARNGFTDEACLATEELEDGTLSIIGYYGKDVTYVIPSDIDGKKVTEIGNYAFVNSTLLTSVTIPDSVTHISNDAFYNCTSLKDVTIPASVTSIYDKAFGYYYYEDAYVCGTRKVDGFKINCYKDTAGEQYAKDNDFDYEILERETQCTHSNTEIRNAVSAGCTTEGYTGDTYCTDCDELISSGEVIPATGHTEVVDKAVAATCTKTGLTEGIHCSVCNAVIKAQEVVPAHGHTEVIDKAVAATCTKTGLTEGKHCSVCNAVIKAQEVIPAKGHTEVTDKAVAATCTKAGLTEGKHCSVCKTVLKAQETIPATGDHKFGDWTITKAATCTTAGTQTRTCSGCGKVETQTIKALGHKYSTTWTTDKAATCGAAGSKSHHCTRCGAKKDVTAIPVTGKHDFNDWKTTKAATYTATGTKTRTCKVCKKTETATIAKLTLAKIGGFKVKAKDSTSITLQWSRNANASGYIIEAYNGKTWVQVTKIAKNSTLTYKVTKLSASKTYRYRIKAYKTEGKATAYSANSATLSVNTNPTNMSGFKAKAKSYNSITLQWNKNTSATGYELQKWDGKKWVALTKISKNSTTTYTVKSLKASTTYKYRIRAYKTIGKATQYSAYSATLSVNTNPTNMSGYKVKSKTATSVTLQWNKNTSATGYELQKWDGKKWASLTKISKNSTTTYTLKSLKAGTTYKYRIRAYKTIGKAKQYSAYSATLSVNTNPSNMSGFKAKTKTATSITLQWNKNTSATGYEIQKWDGKKWVSAAKVTKNSTVTSIVKSLKKNTSYKFRIRAYKTIGKATQYSSWSGTLTVKTKK